ncbi:MAG: VOC family protein [Ignavibacteriae bacterium]|nr:MAG: VOC family protein [Ignavibacteriota bacterium]
MANAINWFEIPVLDFKRAQKFYNSIFEFELFEQQMGDYVMGFFPGDQSGVSGAICHGEGYKPSEQGTLVYLNADGKLDDVIGRIETNGGKVVMPKSLVTEEIGYIATFIDTEGNKVALHSPKN